MFNSVLQRRHLFFATFTVFLVEQKMKNSHFTDLRCIILNFGGDFQCFLMKSPECTDEKKRFVLDSNLRTFPEVYV